MLQMDTKPGAWVCTNENNAQTRGRKKVYQPGSKIYLNDNQNFEIELYNPSKSNVLAKIQIDGKYINAGGLVIKSGQRVYLECFPDSRKKFTFKTYTVKNTEEIKEAISNNGNVKIDFYKEKSNDIIPIITNYPNSSGNWNYPYFNFDDNFYKTCNTTNISNSMSNNTSNVFYTANLNSSKPLNKNLRTRSMSKSKKSIETGQVEGGDNSNQKFESVYMNFESWVYASYFYKLLPKSQEPAKPKDFKVKVDLNYTNKGEQMLEKLKDLKTLLDDNLITKDEFNHMKDMIISS